MRQVSLYPYSTSTVVAEVVVFLLLALKALSVLDSPFASCGRVTAENEQGLNPVCSGHSRAETQKSAQTHCGYTIMCAARQSVSNVSTKVQEAHVPTPPGITIRANLSTDDLPPFSHLSSPTPTRSRRRQRPTRSRSPPKRCCRPSIAQTGIARCQGGAIAGMVQNPTAVELSWRAPCADASVSFGVIHEPCNVHDLPVPKALGGLSHQAHHTLTPGRC